MALSRIRLVKGLAQTFNVPALRMLRWLLRPQWVAMSGALSELHPDLSQYRDILGLELQLTYGFGSETRCLVRGILLPRSQYEALGNAVNAQSQYGPIRMQEYEGVEHFACGGVAVFPKLRGEAPTFVFNHRLWRSMLA